ncbi:hypothetical protein CHLRE_17g745297v5 [Chlamydomonas reinhardtii]|uniref:Uncharacterized protein n=1 Tax=Chlamydomonas reinhardtii TaxID=3055 RepID=A0A2K3CS10_CHLRE|nr:uncharacterized protein CHLRE_17g745297v5 [Chlamydomonas reinhardtii]PNW71069.1 hypothetical protein CHLRE_17g745297v5 [Chlamydomonas reinhardtii]
MVTIREALLSVAGEDSTSIQTIVETLAGQGFHAHEQAGGAFCLLEADKVAGLNLRQRLALKAAVQAVAAGLGVGSATGPATTGPGVESAAGAGSLPPAAAGADMAAVRQVARDAALAVLEAQTAPRKPKSFSSVGNTEASLFLRDLKLVQVVGNAVFEEELQLPDGTPTCIGFDMSGYADEDAATGPLLAHHKEQLRLLGVRFGRAAFDIYDVHSLKSDSLLIQHGNKAFRGIFDGCIAPYGLSLTSSLTQCRIVYEHKMPKALNARKGQAIVELLAACAYGPCPVLLDLTDGMKHIVYTIRGAELIAWTELTPTQAYNLQARHLMSDTSRTARGLTLEQIPEEEQAWMRPLHQLRPESGLHEQLESVIPFLPPDERMPAALELIHAWAQQAQQPAPPMQLPDSMWAFYS